MKVYPPSYLTIRESKHRIETEQNFPAINVTDEILIKYVNTYTDSYKKTLDEFAPNLATALPNYRAYPFKITIIKWGVGILIFFQESTEKIVEIKDIKDLNLTSFNFFDIKALFDPCMAYFDFSGARLYSEAEAEISGKLLALDELLQVFWFLIDIKSFEELCVQLLEAETQDSLEDKRLNGVESGIDLELEILINEFAGFRRTENWGFIFKHYKDERVSAETISEFEQLVANEKLQLDILCLVTSGDVTSIGKAIAVKNPKMRIWDRSVLSHFIYKNLNIIGKYFEGYDRAVETITLQIEKLRYSRYKEFQEKLRNCPHGQKNFAQYEQICKEILEYVFERKLKPSKSQSETKDKTQRRDLIFRNLRESKFFERIFTRFDADFIVFDPKNYEKKITKIEFESISKYPNKAIGRFAVLISRLGESERARDTQHRIFTNNDKIILSISDQQLLEMVERKEKSENPEDLLEDLLDTFLKQF